MRILTEYGFISIFGVLFTSTTQIVSCIMFRIDLNDMFILCGSFYRTDSEKSTADHVDETIQDIAILSMENIPSQNIDHFSRLLYLW